MTQPVLNPFALAPQVNNYDDGILKGYLQFHQRQDYKDQLERNNRLLDIVEEMQRMELDSKRSNVPVEEQQRKNTLLGLQSRYPFIPQEQEALAKKPGVDNDLHVAQAAQTKAATEIAKAAAQDKRVEMSVLQTKRLLEQAVARGPDGLNYVKSQYEQLNRDGYAIPEDILDPRNWKQMHSGLVQTVEFLQQMQRDAAHWKNNIDVANINAGPHWARVNQDKKEAELKKSNAPQQAFRLLNDPKSTDAQKETAREILQNEAENAADRRMNELVNNPLGLREAAKAAEQGVDFTDWYADTRQRFVDNAIESLPQTHRPSGWSRKPSRIKSKPVQPNPRQSGGEVRQAPSSGGVKFLGME